MQRRVDAIRGGGKLEVSWRSLPDSARFPRGNHDPDDRVIIHPDGRLEWEA